MDESLALSRDFFRGAKPNFDWERILRGKRIDPQTGRGNYYAQTENVLRHLERSINEGTVVFRFYFVEPAVGSPTIPGMPPPSRTNLGQFHAGSPHEIWFNLEPLKWIFRERQISDLKTQEWAMRKAMAAVGAHEGAHMFIFDSTPNYRGTSYAEERIAKVIGRLALLEASFIREGQSKITTKADALRLAREDLEGGFYPQLQATKLPGEWSYRSWYPLLQAQETLNR